MLLWNGQTWEEKILTSGLMGCKGHTLILFQGVLIFKERVNGALECEWAGLIEDDRADQAPLRGKCHQNTHSLVLLTQGITETAQFKSNTLNLLHLSCDISIQKHAVHPKLGSQHGQGSKSFTFKL